MSERLDDKIIEYVKISDDGNVKSVDWAKLNELHDQLRDCETGLSRTYDKVISSLNSLGVIFNEYEQGSYSVVEGIGRISLNPREHGNSHAYAFSSLDDARDYARAFFRDALYTIEITQQIETVKKD